MRPSDGPGTGRQALEVAHILQRHGDTYAAKRRLPLKHLKAMHHIRFCRTAVMGGHRQQCDRCGFERNAYNSCGDRHCPKCRTLAKERWLDARRSELLPTGYFHLVFTLPHDLNPMIHCNPKVMLDNLFGSVNETLQAFAADPRWRLNGRLGFVGVLHTWSQTLIDHFHLHCLVPAGAWSFDRSRWNPSRKSYLFRVKSLAKQFRKTYLGRLQERYENGELRFPGRISLLADREEFARQIGILRKKQWIVYAKAPFAGPEQVIDYLGRYTHRVAISNHRLLSMDDGKVTFSYKDRSRTDRTRRMTLSADEFIRRFLLHVLPPRFVKIRYFGFLFHRDKRQNIASIREQMGSQTVTAEPAIEDARQIVLRLMGIDIHCCPQCRKGRMLVVHKIPKCCPIRDPP
ncbi:IS91 family transposase [uncultured Desulfosarcina sp.]|uniref:IS91 family transposase n=1 Tax=uncultured Desulfosarcina sp. TaxID=218289 RepID=UPI0029C77160|nr:IS91 family transposase [uncultured Desulfosarcina sp.]